MLLTRIGEGSKMVVTGDLKQSDLGPNNGMADLVKRMTDKELDYMSRVVMHEDDIARHPAVSEILDLY